ncbi:MAG: hypothetical protein PUE01_05555 [Clostridiaceae bacterium]|nr:hypothetical protein [Clostridiaceae bacterium]
MDKECLNGLNGEEVWKKLYNKELNTKKNILEYIELTKILKKGEIDYDQIEMVYSYVYEKIDELVGIVKPNTIMYLKNELKKQLGKYVFNKDPEDTNYFIEFFKEAFPKHKRRKDFTWVLMDLNRIADDQILTTLKYINNCILKGAKLNEGAKKDIVNVIKILVDRKNIHNINDVRSLQALNNELKIKIIEKNKLFAISSK